MKIKEALDALEQFAPLPLQESYDNAGLQVGLTEADVSGVLLCRDVTEDVVENAIRKGCNLVVSHHPLLFRGLKQISDADYVQRTVWKAIQHNIAIVAMHTNLDNANNGVNHKIAQKIGLGDVRFLADTRTVSDKFGGLTPAGQLTGGSGIIGKLEQPMKAEDFISLVKKTFSVNCCMTNELLERDIQTVAVCGGAGAFLLNEARRQHADAFITGEMHYHEYFGAEQEIQIMVIGHYESEQFTTQLMQEIIERRFAGIPIHQHGTTNPIRYWV